MDNAHDTPAILTEEYASKVANGIAEGILAFIGVERKEEAPTQEAKQESTPQAKNKIDVRYQTYSGGKWLPDVLNTSDHAGVFGQGVNCFRGNTVGSEAEAGKLISRVHTKGGRWLGEVIDREKCSNGDDFAGIKGRLIDAIMIRSTKGQARCRVHTKMNGWLPWVTGYDENDSKNGYAGIMGDVIDAIQVEIV